MIKTLSSPSSSSANFPPADFFSVSATNESHENFFREFFTSGMKTEDDDFYTLRITRILN